MLFILTLLAIIEVLWIYAILYSELQPHLAPKHNVVWLDTSRLIVLIGAIFNLILIIVMIVIAWAQAVFGIVSLTNIF